MLDGRVTNPKGYAKVVESLARRALAVARDAAPHRAREGERRWPMANALPAVRVLLDDANAEDVGALAAAAGQLAETFDGPSGKVTDGFGHHRPGYVYLALHLLGTAARMVGDGPMTDAVQRAATRWTERPESVDEDTRLVVWRRLILSLNGLQPSKPTKARDGHPAPLVVLGRDDLIDAWTYRELVGLHGLHLTALLHADEQAAASVTSAALYHLGHTQPDYTTYQPWALAAFASDERTAGFAEQQLHDVATHLSLSGPGSAVLPALLLADAWAAMAGRVKRAWAGR